MKVLLLAFFDVLLVWFFFGNWIKSHFFPAGLKLRCEIKDLEKHFASLLRRNRDVFPAKVNAEIRRFRDVFGILRQNFKQTKNSLSKDSEEKIRGLGGFDKYLKEIEKETFEAATMALVKRVMAGEAGPQIPARRGPSWLRNNLEVGIVALGLAFGVRALFFQPFKIPTGSMQPTLFGIHFLSDNITEPKFGPVGRFFDFLHYSRRHVEIEIKQAGNFNVGSFQTARPTVPVFGKLQSWLLPATTVNIGGQKYRLPGAIGNVQKYLYPILQERMDETGSLHFDKGEKLVSGSLSLGDHLFVDRTYLAFRDPKRGDVSVFRTDGIRYPSGKELIGPYYIKRLVGLPGDTLRITDRKLYLKEKDASEFRLVDENDCPGFGRMYSFKGGYHGYSHLGGFLLKNNKDTFTVPDGQYLMLGDNSENSSDGRSWGTVPRENLIGRALFVWWPFTRRWGPADRVEPEDFPSPPSSMP